MEKEEEINEEQELNLSKITQIILNFYNKNYNKSEEIEEIEENTLRNSLPDVLYNYKKTIIKNDDNLADKMKMVEERRKKEDAIKKEEKKEETNKKTKISKKDILHSNNQPKIDNFIIIKDKELFEKILKYRMLEIKKKIRILQLCLLIYSNVIANLCVYDKDDEYNDEYTILNKSKDELEKFITEYINKTDSEMENAIKNYLDLSKFYNIKK